MSETRTYVAICNKTNFDGFYLKKFTLPENVENSREFARWYFLNELNFLACLEKILTIEELNGMTEQKEITI